MQVSRVKNAEQTPYRCTDCHAITKQMWVIRFRFHYVSLCDNCLKTLRAKIDRLAFLVTEGVTE